MTLGRQQSSRIVARDFDAPPRTKPKVVLIVHYHLGIARGNLKKDDYVTAAIDYVDSHGIDAMTMRSLGAFMDIDATAVYRHFPTKEDLVYAMVDRFLQMIENSLNQKLAEARERIVDRARCTRSQFEKHPDVGVATVYSTGQSMAGFRMSVGIAKDLELLGVPAKRIPMAYQMLEGFVLGSCCQDFIGSPDNYSIRRNRYRAFDSTAFDAVAKSEKDVKKVADNAFEQGLSALLDYITSL